MQLFDTYYKHQFHKLFNSDFWLFEMSIWLHVIARSLISVFVPVLMLIKGFSLTEVLIYYLLYHIIDVVFNFWARSFVRKYGARLAIIVANIAIITFFILLSQLSAGLWNILIAMAFLGAMYDTFFWVAHLYLFVKSGDAKEANKETSVLYIVKRAAGLISPLVGAMIIIVFSEGVLIVAAILFFALSIIPLLRARQLPDRPKEKQLSWREFFKDSKDRINFLSFSIYTLHRFNERFFWPLFVFFIIGTIESVAFVPVIVSIAAIFFSYLAGKVNKCDYSKIITVFSILIALVWIFRLNIESNIFLFVSVFIVGIFSIFIDLPLDSNIFSRAKIKDPLSAMMWRNTISMGIRIPILLTVLLLVNVFNVSFTIAILGLTILAFIQILLLRFYKDLLC